MNLGNIGKLFDLAIVESFDGGDLSFNGVDLNTIDKKENQPYVAMFGGMADKSQWWGNALVLNNRPSLQYNSLTEWTLNNTALTSAGRRSIETAISKDLAFLKPTLVQVSIVSDNKLTCLLQGDFGESIFNFIKRADLPGDFFFLDFNDDFF